MPCDACIKVLRNSPTRHRSEGAEEIAKSFPRLRFFGVQRARISKDQDNPGRGRSIELKRPPSPLHTQRFCLRYAQSDRASATPP